MRSEAAEAVMAADHPSHEDGGPCHDCAFRKGSEASKHKHTVALATFCVEGLRLFHCHVHPGLCRGYVAAVNLRGVPETEEDRHHAEACGFVADTLSDAIRRVVDEGLAHA